MFADKNPVQKFQIEMSVGDPIKMGLKSRGTTELVISLFDATVHGASFSVLFFSFSDNFEKKIKFYSLKNKSSCIGIVVFILAILYILTLVEKTGRQ